MTSVLLIALELELESHAAVKAPERAGKGDQTTHPLSRDAQGRPYLPASSLAGSLRAHMRRHHIGQVETLMGEEPGTRTSSSRWETNHPGEEQQQARPSAIRFLGTRIEPADDTGFELAQRGRTAVDRHRAAPANHKLRTDELLPPGTRISCWLRVDDLALHTRVLGALADWRPTIGGGRSTGLGRARVTTARYQALDLNTPEGRARWLTQGGEDLFAGGTALDLEAAQPEVVLRASWEIVDGLSITTGEPELDEATGRTVARVLTGRFSTGDGNRTRLPYVPGSTWKGVLRSQVEYILRSLDLPVCDSTGPDGTCGKCDVCIAFGYTTEDDDGDSVGQRALLHFADSPITGAALSVRQHVPLDRFTGGAAAGLLYARQVVDAGHLTLTITRDPDLTTPAIPPLAVAALRLAYYDLHAGQLGLGGATTRGLGTVRRRDLDEAAIEDERRHAAELLAAALTDTAAPQESSPA
ncbi:RAMP superfamily CRISPR-associated protein [Streptomyces sp. DT224]|uniref:RAMP superfamily CRISPR-associated protein n=1 Tax=Streptomyces sp. DT224 TaxID=3393426 RepID=UPI003CECF217